MNSNMKLSEQLWAEQLHTWYSIDPLHLSLCNGSNFPRGNEQWTLLYEQLWVKQLQTILNFSPLDSGGGHLNK